MVRQSHVKVKARESQLLGDCDTSVELYENIVYRNIALYVSMDSACTVSQQSLCGHQLFYLFVCLYHLVSGAMPWIARLEKRSLHFSSLSINPS